MTVTSPGPVLETPRLRLRPFTRDDAPDVQRLAGDRAIADTTLTIPHPYPADAAEAWIERGTASCAAGRAVHFCVTRRSDGAVIGAIGLALERDHERAELGYWVGVPYWNNGYASEAAQAIVEHGFRELGLHRIQAHHMVRNPASGRVLRKVGMTPEGRLRDFLVKWGVHEDVELFAILRSDWEMRRGSEEGTRT